MIRGHQGFLHSSFRNHITENRRNCKGARNPAILRKERCCPEREKVLLSGVAVLARRAGRRCSSSCSRLLVLALYLLGNFQEFLDATQVLLLTLLRLASLAGILSALTLCRCLLCRAAAPGRAGSSCVFSRSPTAPRCSWSPASCPPGFSFRIDSFFRRALYSNPPCNPSTWRCPAGSCSERAHSRACRSWPEPGAPHPAVHRIRLVRPFGLEAARPGPAGGLRGEHPEPPAGGAGERRAGGARWRKRAR